MTSPRKTTSHSCDIGYRLKTTAKKRGLDRQAVADLLPCSPGTVSRYYSGKIMPSEDILRSFADIFDVRYEYLACIDDYETLEDEINAANRRIQFADTMAVDWLRSIDLNIGHITAPGYSDPTGTDTVSFGNCYDNDAIVTHKDGSTELLHNCSITVNGTTVPLVLFYDLLNDLENYAGMLTNNIADRLERYTAHAANIYAKHSTQAAHELQAQLHKVSVSSDQTDSIILKFIK